MKHRRQLIQFIVSMMVISATCFWPVLAGQAGIGTFVPFLSGFGGAAGKGLELPGGGIYQSSPTLADLNHDGKLEILIGSGRDPDGVYRGNGYLHAVDSTGRILWSAQGRLPTELGSGEVQPPINSSPSVITDINGDGWDDVVVGLGGEVAGTNWNGGVAAFSGKTGDRLWVFYSDDWLNHKQDGFRDGVFSTPAVGDVNGDGNEEIAFGSWDQCIYLLNRLGQPLWTNLPGVPLQTHCKGGDRAHAYGFYNEDTIWSSPAMADLNGDGKLEIIIGADISAGNRNHDPNGGYLYVFSYDGTVLARQWLEQAVYSSAAIGDIDGDGALEIVVGTGHPFPNKGYFVTAWKYSATTGLTQKWKWDTSGQVFASPALTDIDGDGVLDVIAISYVGDYNTCAGHGSQVYVWRGTDGALVPGFPASPKTVFGNNDQCIGSSPTVADIDSDGHSEILFANGWEATILNHDGSQYTDSTTGGTKPTFWGYCSLSSSPAIGDINHDGKLEVVAGGVVACDTAQGFNDPNAKTGGLKVWQTTAPASGARPWPMFHQNAQHTGRYPRQASLSVSPSSLFFFDDGSNSSALTQALTIQNDGDLPLVWALNTSGLIKAQVSGNTSGTAVTSTQVLVTVQSEAVGSSIVSYSRGTLTVNGTDGGAPVSGSPQSVLLKLFVGPYPRVFLPAILR